MTSATTHRITLPFLVALIATLAVPAATVAQTGEPNREAPDRRVRVLLVSGAPNWAWRYLRNDLSRVASVRLDTCFVGDADSPFNSVALPRTARELAAFDVVYLHDVTRDLLEKDLGKPAEQDRWCAALATFLDNGGGVAFVCGPTVPEYFRGNALERRLPVLLRPPAQGDVRYERQRGRVTPAAGANADPALVLEPGTNGASVRDTFAKLAPIGYVPLALGLAPTGRALLVDEQNPVARKPALVVAVGTAGKGRTAWIGSDEFFQWRNPHGNRYTQPLWRNITRHLAGGE